MTSPDWHSSPVIKRWLKQQGATLRRPLFLQFALMLSQFGLTIWLYWLVAVIAQQLSVNTEPSGTRHIFLLVIGMLSIQLVSRLHLSRQQALQRRVCNEFEQKLNRQLNQQQLALTRQFSVFYWQTAWTRHIPSLGRFYSEYQPQLLLAGITPFIILAVAFTQHWVIGTSLLLAMPTVPVFMIIVGKGAASLHRKHFSALERLGGMFTDRLQALPLLAAFQAHQPQQQRLEKASHALNQRTLKVVRIAFLSNTVLDFFSTVSVALVAVFIGFNLLGELDIGPALSFQQGLFLLLSVPLVFAELKNLGRLYHQKAEAEAAATEIAPLLHQYREPAPRQHFTRIDWQNFQLDQPLLQAQSLQLSPGQKIRLTGDSGAGKTVFLESLMGWRKASHQLPGRVVMLSQHSVILPGTVKENLCLGHAHPTQKLLNVLNAVQLGDWLAQLHDGLNTRLGEQVPMSGGQQQRLCLARILLQQADIVLLDEPTAHLTEQQHQQLSQLLATSLSEKTVIWASHKKLEDIVFDHTWHIANGKVEGVK